MGTRIYEFNAIFSSDWNECLAPCGPFDVMAFHYPDKSSTLKDIFRKYTGNMISLGDAVGLLKQVLPAPISKKQMDAYLEQSFTMYKGVGRLIKWCHDHNILFMINTTGMIGYFQRAMVLGLMPRVPVLSANASICFADDKKKWPHIFNLNETQDKAVNTSLAIQTFQVNPQQIIIMGDSGGDGPHFKWAGKTGAYTIGSMTKPSLSKYCQANNVLIDHHFGIHYRDGDIIDRAKEMQVDFTGLVPVIETYLKR